MPATAAVPVGLPGSSLSVGGIEDVDFRGGMAASAFSCTRNVYVKAPKVEEVKLCIDQCKVVKSI